jgi:membrane fusion protein (multidrug efflux system)
MKLCRINSLAALLVAACVLSATGCGGSAAGTDKKDEAKASAETKQAASETKSKGGKDEETAIPVEAARVAREAMIANYTGTAALEAEREAQVVAKTSGVLLKLLIEEGDQVEAGQVLAQLDPERAQLELARAEASLRRLENDHRRAQELYATKLISSEAHDKVRFDLDTQRAAYDLAKLELSYTRIQAPIDGVLSERMVKEGNLIQLHQGLFRIDDFDPLLAVLNVPERELSTLKPGLAVTMSVDALPGRTFGGKVARVSPVVDAATGTFRVTCEFRDDSGSLKSGMFGRLDVVYDERADALVIPREALIEEDGETAVYTVKDGVAHRQPVSIGYSTGSKVEIREGLAEGDQVVTVGRAAVREGTKVTIIEAQS